MSQNNDHWTQEQRDFFNSLGDEGIKAIGERIFDYIKVVETGGEEAKAAFRTVNTGAVERGYGLPARRYFEARMADVEEQYSPACA